MLWILLLVLVLAGVWWYYNRKINQLDHKLNFPDRPQVIFLGSYHGIGNA